MPTTMYVIDTSYILHLFDVPGYSDAVAHNNVLARVKAAENTPSHRIYIPLPILYEFANHIADVRNGDHRQKLANFFTVWVADIIAGHETYIIPRTGDETLLSLTHFVSQCSAYCTQYACQSLGLSDTALISEASRLKQKYRQFNIHIWTTDKRLKTHEPDAEENAFTG